MNIYFDNAATTPIHPQVLDAMLPYFKDNFGNPSSIHSFGRKVKVAVEDARQTVADFLNADPSEIYFTSGGTESNNLLLRGLTEAEFIESGRQGIISSNYEHPAVLESLNYLSKIGYSVTMLPVEEKAEIVSEQLKMSISNDICIISIMLVNNEIGSINDINGLAKTFGDKNIYFHTDAVQGFGKIKIDVKKMSIDTLAASGHKIYGPKGIGIAYIKNGTPMKPLLLGGAQERNRRGGTENVAGIIGLAEAVKIASDQMSNNYDHAQLLREALKKGLQQIDSEGLVFNESVNNSPYILSTTFKSAFYNTDSEAMQIFLDINGLAGSSGSACNSGTLKLSHVIKAIGKSDADAAGTIRFSFGVQNTIDEVNEALKILEKFTLKFRR